MEYSKLQDLVNGTKGGKEMGMTPTYQQQIWKTVQPILLLSKEG